MVVRLSSNDSPSSGRLCEECGQAIGEDVPLHGLPGDHHTLRTDTVVVRSTTWRRWLLLIGVFLAGVIGWSMLSSSAATESDDESAAIDGESETTEEASDNSSTTTTNPTKGTTSNEATDTIVLRGDGEPLLSEEVGYDLIIGVSGEGPSVLDLDTGGLRPAGGGRTSEPLAVSGQWLLVRQSDRIFALPLDDLGADATELASRLSFPYFDLADSQQRADGRVWLWLYDTGSGIPELVVVDIASGDVVDRMTLPEGAAPFYLLGLSDSSSPMLVTGVSGGVYESAGDGYTQVADGRLLVADKIRALIETCNARLQCVKQWLDRTTWEPIDLAVPQQHVDMAGFVNGSDWLLLSDWRTSPPQAHLLNVVSGQEIELEKFNQSFPSIQPAISSDGRWLATTTGIGTASMIQIEELSTGKTFLIEGVDRLSGAFLFIDQRSD